MCASNPERYESHVIQETSAMDPETMRHMFSHPYSADPRYIAIIEPSLTGRDVFETRVASRHVFELLWNVYRLHQRTSTIMDFCRLFQASPTTTARWAFEIQVHEFLRRQQTIHLVPLVQDKSKLVALQLAGSEEYRYAKGDKLLANHYYKPDPADFPTVDSFLLIRRSRIASPILAIFHILWSAREHHVSRASLRSIDGLPLSKSTSQYHVVVSQEKTSPSTLFFEGGGGGKKSSKKFQVFNYPITFTATPVAATQSQ